MTRRLWPVALAAAAVAGWVVVWARDVRQGHRHATQLRPAAPRRVGLARPFDQEVDG